MSEYDYVKCERCLMGQVFPKGTSVGEFWLRDHDCPPPISDDRVRAEAYRQMVIAVGAPIHPRMRGRILSALR